MSQHQVQVVRDLFAAAYRGDVPAMRTYLAPDFSIDQAVGTPYAGHYTGTEGFLEMFGKIVELFDFTPRNQVFHDCGDAEIGVIVTFDVDFTAHGSGRQASTGNVELYRFDGDDLIRHIDVFYKDATVVTALVAPVSASS